MMYGYVLVLVMLLAAAGAAPPQTVTASTSTTASAQEVYDSLPEEEREPFLAYELAMGLDQVARRSALANIGDDSRSLADQLHDAYGIPYNLRLKFKKLPAPSDFDIKMYGWVKMSTDPTFQQMMQLAASGRYCVGSDTCFTLQEPFGNCCPF
ncbi:uncharacterized protein LOC126236262 [Schistocerca nitens]|uniref:uncharacterized protein LOC126236262 n=1 Tax=Schistocerca nitens TaxID=7011 RepID=UPI0021189C45|nr:uncharacterized protein LOC126236262 [Schistocerca nitens]